MLGPVSDWIEEGLSESIPFVAGLPSTLVNELGPAAANELIELVNEIGDLPVEVGKFAADPEGYVSARLQGIADAAMRDAIAVALGGDIGRKILGEIGLRPLVDGVTALANDIADLVNEVLSWLNCGTKMAEYPQIFWSITGALVGARASGLVTSKADCDWILRSGQLAELVGAIPAAVDIGALLDCAVRVAFELPLPEPRPAMSVKNLDTPGTRPIEGVFAVMQSSRMHEEMVFTSWQTQDIAAKINELKPAGWRISQISSYMLYGKPLFDVVLRKTGSDQQYYMLRSPEHFQKAQEALFKQGYVCTALTTLRPGQLEQPTNLTVGQLYITGVFERAPAGQVPDLADLFTNQGEQLDLYVDSSQLIQRVNQLRQSGYEPQFLAPHHETVVDRAGRVDIIGGAPYVGQKVSYTVLSRKGPINGVTYDYDWAALPFDRFAARDAQNRGSGMQLYSVAAIRAHDGQLRVSAVWRRRRIPTLSASTANRNLAHVVATPVLPGTARRGENVRRQPPQPQQEMREIAFHGWPMADYLAQLNALRAQGWSVTALAGYAA